MSTLPRKFFEATRNFKDQAALRWKENGTWQEIHYFDFQEKVRQVGKALIASAIEKGDKVAIFGTNSPQWAILDFAITSIGAVTVPIYSTSSIHTVDFILDHSESKMVFVSDDICAETMQNSKNRQTKAIPFSDLHLFEKQGAAILNIELEKRIQAVFPDDLATLIYTSGTTGEPKGVMLTHQNLVTNCEAAGECFPVQSTDRTLSFLPLSHALERTAGQFLMVFHGVAISYAESMEKIPENLVEVRPTILLTVPRLLEKMYARIMQKLSEKPALVRWILKNLFKRVLGKKVHKQLGGALRLIVSGGAPLAADINQFFCDIGIPVIEGYGLTETSPVISVGRVGKAKVGTVGQVVPGVKVKIDTDGEILCKGPNVMKGYFKNDEATREAIDSEGWFHTGDIGELDSEGFLKITDRKKDLIVTSGGKKVAPQPIENELKLSPLINQVALVGDHRNYIVALIIPTNGAGKDEIQKVVEGVNAKRAHYEQIKKFALLHQEWTIQTGELTPTMKIKRKVIMEKYAREIEGLY